MLTAKTSSGTVVLLQTETANAFEAQGVGDQATVELARISTTIGDFLKDVSGQAKAALAASAPDSVEIEVGFMVGAEGGIVVTKGKAEAHVVIKATWG